MATVYQKWDGMKRWTGKEKTFHPKMKGFGGAYWTRTSDPIDVNDVLYQLSQSTVRLATCYIISYSGPNVNPFFQLFFGKSKFFCEVFEAAENPEMAQDFQPECAFVVVGQTGKHGFTADSVAIEAIVRENLAALHATKEATPVHVEIE